MRLFFPALVMKLLDFVAFYGLILMPMGAVLFADYWILPKLGMISNYAEIKKILFSWPSAVSWLCTLVIAYFLPLEIYFLALPGWFIAIMIYVAAAYYQQKILSKNVVGV